MKKLLIVFLALSLLCGCAAPSEGDGRPTADETAAACLMLARDLVGLEPSDTQALLDYFDREGKCAADEQNVLQMTHVSAINDFVNAKSEALELYVISPHGGFTRYDLGGGVASLTRLTWQGELPVISQQEKYDLTAARLTDKGSFIFTMDIPGNPKSKYGHDGYIVPSVLLKTIAPDPIYTELCEKYVSPIGYARCDLLKRGWRAGELSAIDIGGAYDRLFYLEQGINLWEEGSGIAVDEFTGEVHIPAGDFISLLCRYLPLSAGELTERAEYHAESGEFCFSIPADQSFFDSPQPTAEVVSCTENPDGSLTLTIDEVFLDQGTDRVCGSELTIMPDSGGSFCYLSNKMLP